MYPALVLLSSSVASHTCTFCSLLSIGNNSYTFQISLIAILFIVEPLRGSEYILHFHFPGLHPGLPTFYPYGVSIKISNSTYSPRPSLYPYGVSINIFKPKSKLQITGVSETPPSEGLGEALLFQPQHHCRCNNHIQQRQWYQFLPSKIHQLVIAETGDRPPDPQKHKQHE